MRISTHVVTDFFTNCYIVQDEGTGRTAIIDPGEFNETIKEQIDRIGNEYIDYILLTHCHIDHILGAKELHEYTGAPVVIHSADAAGLIDNNINCINFFSGSGSAPEADQTVNEGDRLSLGDLTIKVMHTPGHTIGSCCYIIDDTIFSGDTIFRMSCGRTDLPTGDDVKLMRSLGRIADMEGDYKIYSGHGEPTTLEFERKSNMYL